MEFVEASSDSRDCGAFFLDVVGRFARADVAILPSDRHRFTCPPVEEIIEQTWLAQMKLAEMDSRRLYDGPLARLVGCSSTCGKLQLTLGCVSYKEFMGTNLTNARLRYTYGQEVLADPLGVSAAVLTSDGYIALGRRSESVAFHKHCVHPLGGMVEPAVGDKLPDPFASQLQELEQELGPQATHVKEILCLGLVRDKQIVQPEMIFDVALDADVHALRQSMTQARDAHEHTELVFVRREPTSVVRFLNEKHPELTPVGMATLLLHGLRHWGSGWFATTRGYLRKVI